MKRKMTVVKVQNVFTLQSIKSRIETENTPILQLATAAGFYSTVH